MIRKLFLVIEHNLAIADLEFADDPTTLTDSVESATKRTEQLKIQPEKAVLQII